MDEQPLVTSPVHTSKLIVGTVLPSQNCQLVRAPPGETKVWPTAVQPVVLFTASADWSMTVALADRAMNMTITAIAMLRFCIGAPTGEIVVTAIIRAIRLPIEKSSFLINSMSCSEQN